MSKIQERKQRWLDFQKPDTTVPFLFLVNAWEETAPVPQWGPPNRPGNVAARLDYALRAYEYTHRRAEWLHDDYLPSYDLLTGTEIFGEAFGCQVHHVPGQSPHALPVVHDARQADLKAPALASSSLAFLFELADRLRAKGDPAALLRMPDIQSPMGIVATIWDKADLFCAMMDSPAAVEGLAAQTRALLVAFHDEWFRRYGVERIAHWPNVWLTRGICLTEDEIGAVSNEMFEDFFLPDLIFLAERYRGLGIHCCADSVRHQPSFLKIPDLQYLNLTSPVLARNDLAGHAAYLRATYQRFAPVCWQCHGYDARADWKTIVESIPAGARVIFDNIPAASREEGMRLCDTLNQLRAGRAGSDAMKTT